MIDASNPNYEETLDQLNNLRSSFEILEKNLNLHVPQGITNEFFLARDNILSWVDEIEFTLQDFMDRK